jgi:RNA polymerase sigma factor (sigma-70 family)
MTFEDRESLYKKNEGLVYHIYKKHFQHRDYGRVLTPEDVIQVGKLGLWVSCKFFDPNVAKFSTYAYPTIYGYMNKAFRSSRDFKLPRWHHDVFVLLNRYPEAENFSDEELSKITSLTKEQIEEALSYKDGIRFEDKFTVEKSHDEIESILDVLDKQSLSENNENEFSQMSKKFIIDSIFLNILTVNKDTKYYKVLNLFLRNVLYNLGLSQEDIGKMSGCSQPQTCRYIKRGKDALKEHETEVRELLLNY